ncbi:MAG: 6,7-dimethyl-8-ribityllumazine synthase [Pseudomonadota bacterium]
MGYGILTVETSEQAWVRAAVTQGNKGKHAAIACMRLLEIAKNFGIDSQGE